MTGNKSIAIATVFGLVLTLASTGQADPVSDACTALANARSALYSLINAKDKSTQDALRAKLQEESGKLDSLLAAMMDSNAKTAAEFKTVWDQFKTTRDQEIIPAIQKGNVENAKKIADSVQLERLSKMWGIMSCK